MRPSSPLLYLADKVIEGQEERPRPQKFTGRKVGSRVHVFPLPNQAVTVCARSDLQFSPLKMVS